MAISAKIIADSLNPVGCRLTTFVLEYPRFIHAEIMTHRVFSKNAASSRAIPIEKMIQQIINNPAMPTFWGKNQSGMQAAEELDDTEENICVRTADFDGRGERFSTSRQAAKDTWLKARDEAIKFAQKLNKLDLHKQICNRILEPWFNIRIILSGTEFENFFALRAHPDAQPEFQVLANLMLEKYNSSEPKRLKKNEWHIPFGDKIDINRLNTAIVDADIGFHATKEQIQEAKIKVAIARCARVSYLNFDGKDDYLADIKLCDRLFGSIPRHLSPTEHVARVENNTKQSGNFKGFTQYRKFFSGENLKDARVKKK